MLQRELEHVRRENADLLAARSESRETDLGAGARGLLGAGGLLEAGAAKLPGV